MKFEMKFKAQVALKCKHLMMEQELTILNNAILVFEPFNQILFSDSKIKKTKQNIIRTNIYLMSAKTE